MKSFRALLVSLLLLAGTPARADDPTRAAEAPAAGLAVATFAAGCFWCVEPPFDKLDGVTETLSGYTQGHVPNPSYRQVSSGGTGHTEAVRVVYDPKKVTYAQLLDVFWRNVDPVDGGGQFCDRGDMYRPGIYFHDDEQKRLAEASKLALRTSGRVTQPIAVEIKPAGEFYVAEDYHQNYYLKNSVRYQYYRWGCGRDARLEKVWGKPGS